MDEKELERADFFPTADDLDVTEAPVVASQREASQRGGDVEHSSVEQPRVSMATELAVLAKRDFQGLKRNPMVLGARLMLAGFMSLLAGLIFWQVGGKETENPIVSYTRSAAIVRATS